LGIDETINQAFAPIAKVFSDVIFFSVPVGGTDLQLIVLWLVVGAAFFTFYLRFINLRGFWHALELVRRPAVAGSGEVSHFQALSTAISGTVGIGNIGGVAIVISLGGPGATFWLMLAGFLGMSTKFAECIAGVKYRRENPDGTVSGGPMYYLEQSLRDRGLTFLAKPMGSFYALAIVIGCLGIGNMFQSNQAAAIFIDVTGGGESFFADKAWLFGLILAVAVGVVIIGARRLPLPQAAWAWRVPAYGIGGVAAFWTIERVAGFWS